MESCKHLSWGFFEKKEAAYGRKQFPQKVSTFDVWEVPN